MTAPHFLRLYLCFAAGYLLSYLFRTVNAVISPELTASLGVSASSLGLLTSAYFIAFAAMQIPAGMLLDRYGPRRVEPVLLTLAACGALAFAAAGDLAALTFARALIGAGVAVCLMAPLKAIATWYPVEDQPSLAGWMMVAGGIGALLSTAPLAAALTVLSWRGIFVVLAVATFTVAIAIFAVVPDTPVHPHASNWAAQWRGVKSVFRDPRFWWLSPLGAVGMGSFMAIQGLWSVPWLIEVNGYSRDIAADHLLLMGIATLGGYFCLGLFSTRLLQRGINARHLFAAGFGLNALVLALIVMQAFPQTLPFSYPVWTLYGVGAAVNVLGFTVLGEGFPGELTARVNTALNLLMFIVSFVTQWGIGVIADASRVWFGVDKAGGLRVAFWLVLGANILVYAWFAFGWRRNASPPVVAATAL